MSAEAYPLAKHGAEAFARMLRVPQHDMPFSCHFPFQISQDFISQHDTLFLFYINKFISVITPTLLGRGASQLLLFIRFGDRNLFKAT
jgi:hypothetical protein